MLTRSQRQIVQNYYNNWGKYAGKLVANVAVEKAKRYYNDSLQRKNVVNHSTMENQQTSLNGSSMFVNVNPPLQRVNKGSTDYRDMYNQELVGLGGQKHFYTLTHFAAKNMYTGGSDLVNMSQDVYQGLFSLGPNSNQNATAIIASNTTPLAQYTGVSKLTVWLDLINLSTLPCRIKISWYRCKDDTND